MREGEKPVTSGLRKDCGIAEGKASERVKMHTSRSLGGGSGDVGELEMGEEEEGELTPWPESGWRSS